MVKIEVVKTWKQRREFVDFPNRLYKGVKEYLRSEERRVGKEC